MTRWMQILYIFALVLPLALGLSACQNGSYGLPSGWGAARTTAIVTSDRSQMPDISWQTSAQRRGLSRDDAALQKSLQQEGSPGIALKTAPVRVAVLLPLSGRHAALGQNLLQAAQLALFDVGSTGFELIPADTESTPEGAARAAQNALRQDARLIIGPVFAEDTRAVKPFAAAARVPMITFSTDNTLADTNTFVFGFAPEQQVVRVAQFARQQGYTRTAVVAPRTDYADLVVRNLPGSGFFGADTLRYDPTQPDVGALVADFVNRNRRGDNVTFDSLLLPLGGESLRSIAALLDQHGILSEHIRFLGTGLWDAPSTLRDLSLDGGWFAAPDPAARHDFERRYQKTFSTVPPRLATLAYDATALAAVLARTDARDTPHSADPYSPVRLTAARGFAGIDGVFRFRADGTAERGLAIIELRNGTTQVIDPAPTAFGIGGT